MMVYLKTAMPTAGSYQILGSVQVMFTKWHTGEELQATVAFIKSLDKNYDDIVQKLRDVYDEMTAEYTEKTKQEQQGILDGSIASTLIRSIDDKILSEESIRKNSIVQCSKMVSGELWQNERG
jgi:hypothetical protein